MSIENIKVIFQLSFKNPWNLAVTDQRPQICRMMSNPLEGWLNLQRAFNPNWFCLKSIFKRFAWCIKKCNICGQKLAQRFCIAFKNAITPEAAPLPFCSFLQYRAF